MFPDKEVPSKLATGEDSDVSSVSTTQDTYQVTGNNININHTIFHSRILSKKKKEKETSQWYPSTNRHAIYAFRVEINE